MKLIAYTAGLLAAVASANAAQAATVVQSYSFQGLLNDNSKTITGSFTLLQDAVTQTASLQSINFTIGSTIYSTATAFLSANNVTGSADAFILWGNVNNGAGKGVQGTTEDFYLTFNPFTLKTWQLAYSEANPTYAVKFSSGSNLTISMAAVPEPASWAMMIGGFALAGLAMRRRAMTVRFA
jgi:hypothetical protein